MVEAMGKCEIHRLHAVIGGDKFRAASTPDCTPPLTGLGRQASFFPRSPVHGGCRKIQPVPIGYEAIQEGVSGHIVQLAHRTDHRED